MDGAKTIVAYNGAAKGSIYKGLAIDPTTNHLFAADFANNRVQIFDNKFKLIGSFTDTTLPRRFAPFDVAVLGGNLYVAFAKRDATHMNQENGPGLGYVDEFSTTGTLIKQLIAQGPLNAPWGMTIAPAGFGTFAGDLLVANFGNGLDQRVRPHERSNARDAFRIRKAIPSPSRVCGRWTMAPAPARSLSRPGRMREMHGASGN